MPFLDSWLQNRNFCINLHSPLFFSGLSFLCQIPFCLTLIRKLVLRFRVHPDNPYKIIQIRYLISRSLIIFAKTIFPNVWDSGPGDSDTNTSVKNYHSTHYAIHIWPQLNYPSLPPSASQQYFCLFLDHYPSLLPRKSAHCNPLFLVFICFLPLTQLPFPFYVSGVQASFKWTRHLSPCWYIPSVPSLHHEHATTAY